MKGPFFQKNLIRYDILTDSNFNDVDVVIDKMKLKYDVVINEQIEVFDSYWVAAVVNQKYNVCVRHHDPMGLFIYARDEQSNDMVTEIADYLNKEIFNEREDLGYKQ